MRALFVNPWIYDFAAYDLWSKPLGLLTIAGYLRNLGCEVSLIDCLDRFHPLLIDSTRGRLPDTTEFGDGQYYCEEIEKPVAYKNLPRKYKRYGLPAALFKKAIEEEERPDIILVTSGMTYWYQGCFDVIKILKDRYPSTPVILGGVYASLCTEHARALSGADIVYKGNDLRQILKILNAHTGSGLNYPKVDIDGPIAAYDLYRDLKYITLKTSKGCPFRCSYCGWYLIEDRYERQDAGFVIREIEYFNKELGVKDFAFYDDALLYKAEEHIGKILIGLKEKRITARFHTPNGLHNRFMTAELAHLLKASGFVQPRLALETSSSKRQEETGSKTTNGEFLKAVGYLKDAGYGPGNIGTYMLIGLPHQSVDEIMNSVEFAAAQGVRIFLEEYSPIPGTADYGKSGLARDADPLFHNNSAFPLYGPDQHEKFRKIKNRVHRLNSPLSIPTVAGHTGIS